MKQENFLSKMFILMFITLIRQLFDDSCLVVLSNLKIPFSLILLIVKVTAFILLLFAVFFFAYKNKRRRLDYLIPILTIFLTINYFFLDRFIPLMEAIENSYVGHILSSNLYDYSLWAENIVFLVFLIWLFFKESKIIQAISSTTHSKLFRNKRKR